MTPEEIKTEVAAQVQAATSELKKKLEDLNAANELLTESVTSANKSVTELTTALEELKKAPEPASLTKATEDIASLKNTVESLKNVPGVVLETATQPVAVKKPTVVPDKVFTVKTEKGEELKVKFTKPSFSFEKTLYISEAEVENTALIESLVKNQTHARYGFRDGVLKQVN